MPTARKLPSGSWRCQVFTGWTVDENGKKKRKYESFTCTDPSRRGKAKCEAEAARFKANQSGQNNERKMLLSDAMTEYIDSRCNVLSPSTIHNYRRMSQNAYASIMECHLGELNQQRVQKWVNDYAKDHSPKTVKNAYGLISAVMKTFVPEQPLNVRLPQKIPYVAHVPSEDEIRAVLDYYREKDMEMYKAVCLAAFGTLRRSEICPLTAEDVHGNTITISKAMVLGEDSGWVTKPFPKNVSSNRVVPYPEEVISILPKEGRLVNLLPVQITNRHTKALDSIGLEHFRFHDFRHYTASIFAALNIPARYTKQIGGWTTDSTLKQIYEGYLDDYTKKYQKVAVDHFSDFMQHEMLHDKEKRP